MRIVGLKGQYFWFAAGAWIGSTFAVILEPLLRHRAPTPRDIPPEYLILLYVPTGLLFAIPFIGWVAIRSRKSIVSRHVTWSVPLLLGVLLFPFLFVSIPLLVEITGQVQGNLIGSSIAATMIVLPLMLGEVSLWCGRRRNVISNYRQSR